MKRFKTLVTALIVGALSLGATAAYAGYKDGLILVRQGKWAKAIREFTEQAETGHAQSQFSLGLIYHLGRGVPKDLKRAYELYKKSMLQDHPPALNNIGMMYLNGDYVDRNYDIAFALFSRAAADHAQSKDNMGRCFENGWGVEADPEQAINFYQLAGDEGFKLGYYHLGLLFEEGRGGATVNVPEALHWYEVAGDNQYAQGYFRMAEIYEQGILLPRDTPSALKWYNKAAALDYAPAIEKLALLEAQKK